ncbi:MAG: CBS domain-containing protein [Chloroflexia bacterium]
MELILTHANADFDALASLLAASRLFPGALPVLPQRMNRNLREFLSLYRQPLPFVGVDELPKEPVRRIILVDTQQIPNLGRPLGPLPVEVEILDHHPLSRPLEPNERYTGGDVGATVTLLVNRLIERGESVSPLEATLLLLGIYEDTGSLSYPSTTPEDLRAAAWLLEQGASLQLVSRYLNGPLSEEQLQLYHQLVANAQVHRVHGWPIVVAHACSAGYVEEVSTLAHRLMDLYDPAALFLVVQLGDTVQLVARSTGEALNAAEAMARFGGGGHAQAAAAYLVGRRVEDVRASLLDVLEELVRPARTAADIMSTRLHTIRPEATLAEAAEQMVRYGHGALPVTDAEGKLLGLLTRRDLDRALHHGLEEAPVSTYMWKGPVTVPPEMPVERVREAFLEHDVGRLLVVDEERRLLGIITRTDLLKLWPQTTQRSQGLPGDWARRLEQAFPGPVLEVLGEAGRVAEELGYALYLVGGPVRDLLLGVPNLDLDLVVEGDAIALAHELASRLGGRVRAHRRFGTAKWILERKAEGMPPALDFVTARTEFYEQPTALPTVEFSSLRHDLYRRDFTINTLAIGLSGAHRYRLFDFYGGKRDLERRLVRVLHNLSFIEDPTRMLRAVRLEQRLGFSIEPRTLLLLQDALQQGLLERTTGERIRHELLLILEEEEPERVLERLHVLGILAHVSPHLVWNAELAARFRRVREVAAGEERVILYLALLTYRLAGHELESLILRYRFRARHSRVLREVQRLRSEVVPQLLRGDVPPHTIYRLLRPFSSTALLAIQVAEDLLEVQQALSLYLERLRFVRTALNGNDLRRLGLAPGPIYKRILGALLDARLDGEVRTRGEEEALLERLLTVEGLSGLTVSA